MFSGEGEDLKLDKLKGWLRTVKRYLARSGLSDDSPGVADYYGFYTEGKANNAFQRLDTEEENLTLLQLTHRFQQLFEASTSTNDTYLKWQNVRQTAGGQPARIMKIPGELADLKGSLPPGSISDYALKEPFLDAMDSRLRRNVDPELRLEDTWDQMVAVAEGYDATMYRTGGYKGSDRSQASSSKTHTPKKENTYRERSTRSISRNTGRGGATAKKRTYAKSNKPSKAEMDHRKAEGACFYSGESGHMANECPKKEVKTNHVRVAEESPESSEGEYEPDTDSTEELDGSGSVRTYKTTVGTPKDRPFQALEFTINFNGTPARALADTGTIGGTLISNKFVTTHNIPYTARKNPVTLKMTVKGSRSTNNISVEVMIRLGKMRVDKVPMLVTPVSDYDILISMADLIKLGALIDCQKNSIYFSKYKVRVTCDGKSRQSRSAMMKPQEVPDFLAMFRKVFVKDVPQQLPPVRKIMHRISLIDPTKLLKTPTFKAPHALMPKYEACINTQMNAGLLHRTSVPGGASIFVEAKSDGSIRPLVDLRFRNDNTLADHTQILEQNPILNAVARVRFHSKIDLSDAYFHTRVHPDDVKYNTIKTPFGGFTSQVMMQADMNAPRTLVRTMEDLFHEELGKNVWVYIDDIFVFSDTSEEHVKHVTNACSKLQKASYYGNPKKSVFFATKLDILGHMIDDDGIHPAPEKIWNIMDWTRP